MSFNSDENEISLYIITSCSNMQVMRIKVITKDVLIFKQILLTSSIRNVWRTVRIICILISGIKG